MKDIVIYLLNAQWFMISYLLLLFSPLFILGAVYESRPSVFAKWSYIALWIFVIAVLLGIIMSILNGIYITHTIELRH